MTHGFEHGAISSLCAPHRPHNHTFSDPKECNTISPQCSAIEQCWCNNTNSNNNCINPQDWEALPCSHTKQVLRKPFHGVIIPYRSYFILIRFYRQLANHFQSNKRTRCPMRVPWEKPVCTRRAISSSVALWMELTRRCFLASPIHSRH